MRLLLIPLLVTQTWAVQATCQLTLVDNTTNPGFNDVEFTLTPAQEPLLADTQTSILTGTIDATFDVDLSTHKTSQITMANGRIDLSDVSFAGSANLFVQQVSYTADNENLSAAVFTKVPPGLMLSVVNGEFQGSDHAINIDQGTISGDVISTPPFSSTPFSESFTPENPINGQGTGPGTVTLTPNGTSSGFQIYDVVVTMPITGAGNFPTGAYTTDLAIVGTIKAAGTLLVPIGEPKIESVGMIPGNKLQIQISGLASGSDYLLTESGNLSSFGVPAGAVTADTVAAPGGAFTATGATATLEVVLPPGTSAFYRVEDAP